MSELIHKIQEAPLEAYIQESKQYALDEFLDNHKGADFLVSHGPIKKENPMETIRLAFATQSGGISDIARGSHVEGSVVYEIPWERLDWDNMNMRKLWVGRAPNCGIQIVHKNVSKLHGHFKLSKDEIVYSDSKSTNGTKLNNKKIMPYEDVDVQKGALISFGGVNFNLYSGKAFYSMVKRIE